MPISPWLLLLPLAGYLCGSLPFAIWITRWRKGTDVRLAGSGHATTTNTIRQAGFGAGALVGVLDLAKGFLPAWVALRADAPGWLVGLTVAAGVAGHCWPVFANFRGGMGLAVVGGGMLAVEPLAMLEGLALLIALTLFLKHGARASVITGLILGPVYLLLGVREEGVWVGFLAGLVIAGRFWIDWKRKYQELWLDRSPSSANNP